MTLLIERTIAFFVDNFPSLKTIALQGPPGLAWSFGALWFAGSLRVRGWRTGYTRKVFHFLIFITAALLQWRCGTPAVCLFGGMCSLAVFYAVWRGDGHPLYEALAREKDAPRRAYFILIPWFATLVGGLAANILFGPLALAGYLVTGLGDAVGEPAGTMFGRHRYRVPSLAGVPATRTLEGSLAVFLMCIAALYLASALSPHAGLCALGPSHILAVAAACTLAEALSPHGWDNAALQIVPTAMLWIWLT
jgi:phytol kinase